MATGLVDILPEIDGLREIWGAGAFWCMWCDLYERMNGPMAFLGIDTICAALDARKLKTNSFTVLTDGLDPHVNLMKLSKSMNLQLDKFVKQDNIQFDARKVKNFTFVDPLAKDSSVRIGFDDGAFSIVRGVLLDTTTIPRGNLHLQLGVNVDPKTRKVVTKSPVGHTNVDGVYVIGDAGSVGTNVLIAAQSGKAVSVYLVQSLATEEYSSI